MRPCGSIQHEVPRFLFLAATVITVIAAAGSTAPAQTPEHRSGLTVPRAAICTEVRDREPIGEATSFPATVGRLYCFTRIKGAIEPTHVTHVWFHGDREVHRQDLDVASPSWRTWTYKTIPEDWTGSWRVDIEDAAGDVIYSIPFSVTAEGDAQDPAGNATGQGDSR